MSYILGDAEMRIKIIEPSLADLDSTKFTDRSLMAAKMAQSEMLSGYIAADEPFAKGTTLSGSAESTGTEKINTTIGDVYLVALIAGALKIADDSLLIYNSTTAKFQRVPRIDEDSLVIGGTGETVVGFYETNGSIAVYIKEATFTTIPAALHYNYWRKLTAPANSAASLDILESDFPRFMDLYAGYFLKL